MRPVVWMSEPWSSALCKRLELASPNAKCRPIVVGSVKEFLDGTREPTTVSFVDNATLAILATIDHAPLPGPIVAVCDGTLQTAIGWMPQLPWLAHVISASMLEQPMAVEHLSNVMSTLTQPGRPKLLDWLGPTVAGRRIRLTHASRRVERLERMKKFFDAQGVSSRTIDLLRDAADELLTNAFYDAPVAAGAVKEPISRTQDVSLPDDSACDMVYGCREGLAIVRVRDPFGSLTRGRLVEVLTRCARTDMQVEVDETMGGAGLGLWRIFTAASFVAISVVNNRHTEFLVGIGKRAAPGPRPFAFHLFFKDGTKRRFWQLMDADSSQPSVNKSITLLQR